MQLFCWWWFSNTPIKEWIAKKISKVEIKSPPPIESIALGALADSGKNKRYIMQGIRLFNRREQNTFGILSFARTNMAN